jgi:hypothetical protein
MRKGAKAQEGRGMMGGERGAGAWLSAAGAPPAGESLTNYEENIFGSAAFLGRRVSRKYPIAGGLLATFEGAKRKQIQ